jgi:hypothetical protein
METVKSMPTEFTLHKAAQWMAFSPFCVFVLLKPETQFKKNR